jgi:hypothetical protein
VASCAYCASTILMGGKRVGDARFCNAKCLANGQLLARSQAIPDETIRTYVQNLHMGPCPKCRGRGPIDVFTSHKVWSAVVVTHWKSEQQVSCKRCGVKSQMVGLASSLVLGWWGIPWGLVITPIQVVRNIIAATKTPDPLHPSVTLERFARIQLASRELK